MTQQSFPVEISKELLQDRIKREGLPYWNGLDVTVMWTGVDLDLGNIAFQSGLKGVYVESISGAASQLVKVKTFGPNLLVNGAVVAGQPSQTSSQIFGPTQVSTVVNELIGKDRKQNNVTLTSVFNQDPRLIIAKVSGSGNGTFSTNKNGGLSGNNVSLGNGTFSYTINVLNTGVVSTGTITVTDTLPLDVEYVSSSGTGWSVNVANGILTATTTDVIPATTGIKTLTIVVKPKSPVTVVYNVYGQWVDIDVTSSAPPVFYAGTSITYGTSALNYRDHYSTIIRNWLRDTKSVKTRIINKGVPGIRSNQWEDLRANDNWGDILEQPVAVFYELFANDSVQSLPVSTSLDMMNKYIDYWLKYSPSTKIFIWAPFPNADVNAEARNTTLNTAAKNNITTRANPKVIYVESVRTSWNPVTESATYTVDGLHPNNAGFLRLANDTINSISSQF